MKKMLALALSVVAIFGMATAASSQSLSDYRGVLCDTFDQIESVIDLLVLRQDMQRAIAKVNAGSQQRVCSISQAQYIGDKEVAGTVRDSEGIYRIYRVTVFAVFNPDKHSWLRVKPAEDAYIALYQQEDRA
jgi:hypothetical protein